MGPALGQHGVNIMEFCKALTNARPARQARLSRWGITIYEDRSFTFITKTPPAAVLLKQALGMEKGLRGAQPGEGGHHHQGIRSGRSRRLKLPDLNANDLEAAMRIIEGTARSMGLRGEKRVDLVGRSRGKRAPRKSMMEAVSESSPEG